jgi:hypothetical protein
MDRWKPAELARMRVAGGHPAFHAFLAAHADEIRPGMPIAAKYRTRAAALYRDRVDALARGDPWDERTSPARSYIPEPLPFHGGGGRGGALDSTATGGAGSGGERFGNGMTVGDVAGARDKYFANVQAANASRPENLRPSEGGRYAGFGSSGQTHTMSRDDDLLSEALGTLSAGWSTFAATASSLADAAAEKARELGGDHIWDTVTSAAHRAVEVRSAGPCAEATELCTYPAVCFPRPQLKRCLSSWRTRATRPPRLPSSRLPRAAPRPPRPPRRAMPFSMSFRGRGRPLVKEAATFPPRSAPVTAARVAAPRPRSAPPAQAAREARARKRKAPREVLAATAGVRSLVCFSAWCPFLVSLALCSPANNLAEDEWGDDGKW